MKKLLILLLLGSLTGFSQRNVDTSFSGFKIDYFANKNPKMKIEYKKGVPSGLVITYHENGALNEVGVFFNKRWIGNYKIHYPNGKIHQDLNFDSNGKKVGIQKYYFENGLIQVIAAAYDSEKDGCSLQFDTLGKLIGTLGLQIDGQRVNKDDKIYDNYKGMEETLLDIVNKENEATLRLRSK